jgi:mannose-1-phosphate guanylyltransferase
MKRTAIIMAGGTGERFWPLSRKKTPKQLLALSSDKTMLEESILRIAPVIPPEDVYIITSQTLLEPIRKAMPAFPPENVVAEPCKRNTAPCLALGAAFIAEKYSALGFSPDKISIAVLTADQNIEPEEGFLSTVRNILDYVENNNVLATIGIQPNRPETGYGYIHVNEPFDFNSPIPEIKHVIRFVEKPDYEKATEYFKAGNFLWNSGMFFWRLDNYISAMSEHLPEVGTKITEMQIKFKNKTELVLPEALHSVTPIFEAFPNISIDYGLMEKAGNVVVARALFNWDDIGSWDSLHRVRPYDTNGNVTEGKTALVEIKDSVIINSTTNSKVVIAGLGLENIVIVATDDAILVCPKDRVQEIKKCVEIIRKEGGDKWL